jgi:hypothetical protein
MQRKLPTARYILVATHSLQQRGRGQLRLPIPPTLPDHRDYTWLDYI